MMKSSDFELYRDRLLERFLKYVKIDTTSDKSAAGHPSTEGQRELLHILEEELKDLGIEDITLTGGGYLIARIPPHPSAAGAEQYIGFMSHVDTSSDCPGAGVKPVIHRNYRGGVIALEQGTVIDPAEFPDLETAVGQTLITSDGTTLLGADDKAGLAEIMTAAEILVSKPDIPHCGIEIIFTPDEETGTGMDEFPVKMLKSSCCYTMDGDTAGSVEAECFNAYKVDVNFTGKVIHLGKARGKLVNAVSMAALFVQMLPGNEAPESADGRYGYFCPLEISGGLEHARLEIYLRDFDEKKNLDRIKRLEDIARGVEAVFERGKVEIKPSLQYTNMADRLMEHPAVMANLETAIVESGLTPVRKSIRGGTDGARLTEMGIPTPNVFTGGQNYHSRQEYASLEVMVKAVETIVRLCGLWAGRNLYEGTSEN